MFSACRLVIYKGSFCSCTHNVCCAVQWSLIVLCSSVSLHFMYVMCDFVKCRITTTDGHQRPPKSGPTVFSFLVNYPCKCQIVLLINKLN